MAVHYRAQVNVQLDTALPRDAVSINPCFRDSGVSSDPAGLASDLASAISTLITPAYVTPVTVKLYDLQGTRPVYPAAVHTANDGHAVGASDRPREVALCLSFYAEHNRPRSRGRLYIPPQWLGGTCQLRPTSTQRDNCGALASIFADLGGADVDWIVWSHADHAAHKVTNWWVDDEWDTVRSRGLRPTTRTTGTTSG